MPLKFVHLSDIHFGQETGSRVFVHDDVKKCLIADAASLAEADEDFSITGVIVTGDIAFSGKADEYEKAGKWLDQLTAAIGCKRSDVMVVPGNHDIDRAAMSPGCKLMLSKIVAGGDDDLNSFLDDDRDREVLYGRFSNYRAFANAYSCPFDSESRFAFHRSLEIAPGRFLAFIGLNSALVCSDEDVRGGLLLGARQRVLPRSPGEELVVLCHHPLGWLQDSDESARYVRSRARVFIHGHIHTPSVKVEPTPDNAELMTLSAGATVPPNVKAGYNFSYNIIWFDWDEEAAGLKVTIVPRLWNHETTRFDVDNSNFKDAQLRVVLRCSNLRSGVGTNGPTESPAHAPAVETHNEGAVAGGLTGGDAMDSASRLLRLRFFRDLTPSQRAHVFTELGVLPAGWSAEITNNVEHQLLYTVLKSGRRRELELAIDAVERQAGTEDDGGV